LDNSNGVEGRTQTIPLSATGQDFTLGVAVGTSSSAIVAPGQSATYTLSVAGEDGFNQSVAFSCGGVAYVTCTFSPNPVNVGSSVTNVTFTVATIAPSVSGPRFGPLPPRAPGRRGLFAVALALAAMAWAVGRRKQRGGLARWQRALIPLALGLLLALAAGGCGSGGAGGSSGTAVVSAPPPTGLTAGTYNLIVQGEANSGTSTASHTVNLTLIVT
jgi:hypothetical protein